MHLSSNKPAPPLSTAPRLAARNGFSLAELIISMVIMGIIFTAGFSSYFLGMRMIEDSRDQVRASQIIQSELEAMRTLTWLDLTDETEFPLDEWEVFTPRGQFVRMFTDRYEAMRKVQTIGTNGTQLEVILMVRWKDQTGVGVQVFNTVFSRNGLNDYHYRAI